jgi:hypothetical protein
VNCMIGLAHFADPQYGVSARRGISPTIKFP